MLLTHAHSDHTGFAERARTTAGVPVWIHQVDAAVVKGATPARTTARRGRTCCGWSSPTLFSLARRGATKPIPIREVSTFADGETLEVPGRPRAVHAPGHTPGCAALLLEERGVLLSGDVLVTRNPLTGRVGPQIMPSGLNRDTPQALRSLGILDGIPAVVLLPGHGEPWTEGAAGAAAGASGRPLLIGLSSRTAQPRVSVERVERHAEPTTRPSSRVRNSVAISRASATDQPSGERTSS